MGSGTSRTSASATGTCAAGGELATFGAGCFWGTERYFQKFQEAHPGAISSMTVGFMGSSDAAQRHPSYEDVCTGKSGHVEVLQLNWNPAATSYDVLVAHFLTFHDPTTRDRQGNDAGPQYASVVFAHNEEQAATARERLGKLQTLLDGGKVSGFLGAKVVTEVLPAREFTPASAKHQRYLERNPNGYCNHRVRFAWPPG